MQNQLFATHSVLNRSILRPVAAFFLAAMLAALAGCGSGGAGGSPASAASSSSTPAGTTTVTTPAASVQLLVSSPQMPSAQGSTVDLTAVVLSATGQAISGKTVTFSKGSDSTAYFSNFSAGSVSDANGQVTAKLNLGTDSSVRTIAISATADSAVGNNSVDVTGTTISASGSNSMTTGVASNITFTLTDSAKLPLKNVVISVASKNGSTVSPASGVTDAGGRFTTSVTPTVAAGTSDTITATAGGVTGSQAVTVSPDAFTITAPAADVEIPINIPTAVSVRWLQNSAPVADNTTVNFFASRPTIGASALTASGNASVNISSASAGPTIISANGSSGVPLASINVTFVSLSVNRIDVQAVPGTIQVTTGSAAQTSNVATISAQVRDSAGNLVKNATVNFTDISSGSYGSLNSNIATTDVNGTASVTYTAGTASSPSNGVVIQATVTSVKNAPAFAAKSNTTSLTISGQALLVRLGTDNLVGTSGPPTTNQKTYIATVTDSAGNAAPVKTSVAFSLRPGRFSKGYYTWDPVNSVWVQTITVTCPNEDVAFSGNLAPPNVDTNGNGVLDPGNVATVTATALTDATGVAPATLTYAKSYATWTEQILEARTGVAGNDPPAHVTFVLPGLGSDYTNASVAPPGRISPFGYGNPALGNNVCTNTN